MMKWIALTALALVTAGCASTAMKGFVGQSLQQAMVRYGPPSNAFDMGDGRRAFQWATDSTITMPTTVQNSGTVIPIGNSATWTQHTTISGGQPITSHCVYTFYGRWSETADTWMIEGFEKPPYACE